jgi:hypothetical protein
MRRLPARLALPALLALVLALPAQAQQSSTERLLLTPPTGWSQLPTERNDKVAISRFVPAGQSLHQWSEMLLVQIYSEPVPPGTYLDQVISTSKGGCDVATPGAMLQTEANGYPAANVTISCTRGKATGLGGLMTVQAIQGKGSLYVVERVWHGPPFQNGMPVPVPQGLQDQWKAFIQSVSLCDTADAKHRCP